MLNIRSIGRSVQRHGLLRTGRIAAERGALGVLARMFKFQKWHVDSPTSARPYRVTVANRINQLKPASVVEVGCGLGSIIARIQAPARRAFDTDPAVIGAARLIRSRSIEFHVGGFEQVAPVPGDTIVAVNFLHDFSPAQVEQWLTPFLGQARYLMLDAIDPACPFPYRYHHDFAFLKEATRPIWRSSCGEDHREFVLLEVLR